MAGEIFVDRTTIVCWFACDLSNLSIYHQSITLFDCFRYIIDFTALPFYSDLRSRITHKNLIDWFLLFRSSFFDRSTHSITHSLMYATIVVLLSYCCYRHRCHCCYCHRYRLDGGGRAWDGTNSWASIRIGISRSPSRSHWRIRGCSGISSHPPHYLLLLSYHKHTYINTIVCIRWYRHTHHTYIHTYITHILLIIKLVYRLTYYRSTYYPPILSPSPSPYPPPYPPTYIHTTPWCARCLTTTVCCWSSRVNLLCRFTPTTE